MRKKRKVLRLRQLRRAREMTQADLGARVGLDTSTISQIESGTRDPSLKKARAIATVFGVSIEDLFGDVEIPA